MKITISYKCSDAGKKAHLLAGGSGEFCQKYVLTNDSPNWELAGELSVVSGTELCVNIDAPADVVPDESIIGDWLVAEQSRRAAVKAYAQNELDAYREKLETLIRDRVTEDAFVGYVEYVVSYRSAPRALTVPPYRTDSEKVNIYNAVKSTPDAVAWLAELESEKEAAKLESNRLNDELAAQRIAEQAIAEAAKKAAADAFRAEHSLSEDDVWYTVEQGCLTNVPCYSSHKRGKNWLAVVSKDPHSSGGLSRDFQPKCKGDFYYDISGLSVGDFVEFGADYYSGGGSKSPERWYGKVTKIDAGYVAFEECDKKDVK